MSTTEQELEKFIRRDYQPGFVTDLESDTLPPGLSEAVVIAISERKNEPVFMREWRLKAYRQWLTMKEPRWAHVDYAAIDYNAISHRNAVGNYAITRGLKRTTIAIWHPREKIQCPMPYTPESRDSSHTNDYLM